MTYRIRVSMHRETDEQRCSVRYQTKGVKVLVGWNGLGGFQSVPGELLNSNRDGVAFFAAGLPMGIRVAWLRLTENNPDEWISGSVSEIGYDPDGNPKVRTWFPQNCPYEYFMAIAIGLETDAGEDRAGSHATERCF